MLLLYTWQFLCRKDLLAASALIESFKKISFDEASVFERDDAYRIKQKASFFNMNFFLKTQLQIYNTKHCRTCDPTFHKTSYLKQIK